MTSLKNLERLNLIIHKYSVYIKIFDNDICLANIISVQVTKHHNLYVFNFLLVQVMDYIVLIPIARIKSTTDSSLSSLHSNNIASVWTASIKQNLIFSKSAISSFKSYRVKHICTSFQY